MIESSYLDIERSMYSNPSVCDTEKNIQHGKNIEIHSGQGSRREQGVTMLHWVVWEGLSKSTFEQRAEEVSKQTMWVFGRVSG